jgi:hypothetical protein
MFRYMDFSGEDEATSRQSRLDTAASFKVFN